MRLRPFRFVSVASCLAAIGCTSAYEARPLVEKEALARLDASAPEPRILALTLAQAQLMSIVEHPVLRRARAERGLADAADVRAEVTPDPQLGLAPFWIVPDAVLGGVAALQWELNPPGTRDARRGLAGALRKEIDAGIASEEWRIAQETRVAWIEVVRGERAVELARDRLRQSGETRDFAGKMLERGATTQVEAAVVELEFFEAERDLATSEGELRAARAHLAESIGLPPGTIVQTDSADDALAPLEPRIPAGDADQALLARLPTLRDVRAKYEIAEHELAIAHLGALPKVALGPQVERDADSTKWGGAATISLPGGDRNRGEIAEATTRRDLAAHDFEVALFEARARLARARSEEQGSARALALHESHVAPSAAAAAANAEKAVEAGASDLLAVLLARQRALRAEQAGLALRAAHALAVARLEAAFGPDELEQDRQP